MPGETPAVKIVALARTRGLDNGNEHHPSPTATVERRNAAQGNREPRSAGHGRCAHGLRMASPASRTAAGSDEEPLAGPNRLLRRRQHVHSLQRGTGSQRRPPGAGLFLRQRRPPAAAAKVLGGVEGRRPASERHRRIDFDDNGEERPHDQIHDLRADFSHAGVFHLRPVHQHYRCLPAERGIPVHPAVAK